MFYDLYVHFLNLELETRCTTDMATSGIETLDEDQEHIDIADDFISSDDEENLQSSELTSDPFHEEIFNTETDRETEPEPDEDDHSKTSRRLVLSLKN